MEAPPEASAYWSGFAWVSAGLLLNASLITIIGFILSCTLCYLLAVQGLRRSQGQAGVNSPRTWLVDFVTGLLISAPVFWMFTKFLAINLPGLTATGWI
jgi:putative tricarboxylic transport membrane protein